MALSTKKLCYRNNGSTISCSLYTDPDDRKDLVNDELMPLQVDGVTLYAILAHPNNWADSSKYELSGLKVRKNGITYCVPKNVILAVERSITFTSEDLETYVKSSFSESSEEPGKYLMNEVLLSPSGRTLMLIPPKTSDILKVEYKVVLVTRGGSGGRGGTGYKTTISSDYGGTTTLSYYGGGGGGGEAGEYKTIGYKELPSNGNLHLNFTSYANFDGYLVNTYTESSQVSNVLKASIGKYGNSGSKASGGNPGAGGAGGYGWSDGKNGANGSTGGSGGSGGAAPSSTIGTAYGYGGRGGNGTCSSSYNSGSSGGRVYCKVYLKIYKRI